MRRIWDAAHRPAPGVPRWALTLAAVVPLLVLPSGIWRITVVWFFPPGDGPQDDVPQWLPIEVYVVLVSIVAECLAYSAYALVTCWGGRLPRWLVGVPAAFGSVVLMLVTCTLAVFNLRGLNIRGEPLPEEFPLHTRDFEGVLAIVAYAPLLLWGPLLAILTVAYWRRRSRSDRTNPNVGDDRGSRAFSRSQLRHQAGHVCLDGLSPQSGGSTVKMGDPPNRNAAAVTPTMRA